MDEAPADADVYEFFLDDSYYYDDDDEASSGDSGAPARNTEAWLLFTSSPWTKRR